MAVKMTTGQQSGRLDDEVIEGFQATFRGALLRPNDAGYDEARKLWNGMIDKRPALIARCTGTADVVSAVNFAREQGLLVAVRGGGHNVAGNASNDGGIMIDLSAMKGIQVDPVRRTARVQAGANWGDVDHETQLHGLMTPGGVVSPTGVAGFTLGGGMGVTRRKHGLACDNLISAEVVTADGQVLRASEREHPDLFWAIRGGGGNFGIVTWFEFQLHPLGPEFYMSARFYPRANAKEILRGWRSFIEHAPDEVSTDFLLWNMPPLPGLPADLIGVPILMIGAWYAGGVADGERELQPLRQIGEPLLDLSRVARYVQTQSNLDLMFPDTFRYYWKSLYARRLSDEAIDTLVELAEDKPSIEAMMGIRSLGGAVSRIPEEATAYGNRDAMYNMSIDTTWQKPADDERMIAWTRAAWSRMNELMDGGVYLNFAGLGEDNDDLARAGYGRNYARLVEVKRRYDPANLFKGNINITP